MKLKFILKEGVHSCWGCAQKGKTNGSDVGNNNYLRSKHVCFCGAVELYSVLD